MKFLRKGILSTIQNYAARTVFILVTLKCDVFGRLCRSMLFIVLKYVLTHVKLLHTFFLLHEYQLNIISPGITTVV